MCGIAGLLLSPKDLEHVSVSEMIKTLGLEIESRGRDATGVARLTTSDRLRVAKAPSRATDFFAKHPDIGQGCRLALVHTRAATQGDPRDNANNHPITSGSITGIHNGIVGNDDALFKRHGWKRVGDVDSEVIFTAINNLGWKQAMETVEGSIACAWHDMTKPGHLFVARHTTNPLHVGIADSGSVVFASTNAAVAKAMAVLGSTSITIDSIKEGAMIEFFIDEEGILRTIVNEFTPPKQVWTRPGVYEFDSGGWFPSGTTAAPRSTVVTSTKPASTPIRAFDIGRQGYTLRLKDEVVFIPGDPRYGVLYGTLAHFGARVGWCFVEVDFDFGVSEELCLPVSQLLPRDVFDGAGATPPRVPAALELPPAPAPELFDAREEDEDIEDFYCPKTLGELITAIEEVFGQEAVDLLPMSWDTTDDDWLTADLEHEEMRD